MKTERQMQRRTYFKVQSLSWWLTRATKDCSKKLEKRNLLPDVRKLQKFHFVRSFAILLRSNGEAPFFFTRKGARRKLLLRESLFHLHRVNKWNDPEDKEKCHHFLFCRGSTILKSPVLVEFRLEALFFNRQSDLRSFEARKQRGRPLSELEMNIGNEEQKKFQ